MKRFSNIALFVALALGGCSLIVDDNTPRVTNHCAGDVDCSNGAHCEPTSAMCVQDPAVPYDLWLEVAPPVGTNGNAPTPVDLGPYRMFGGSISLPVPRQISAHGFVRRDGVPVTAQITFTPQPSSTSPIGARSVSTTTVGGGDVDFTLSLPARVEYDVLVEPLGDDRATVPPFRSHLGVGVTDMAVQIPLPTDETHIEGDLVDAVGGVSGFEIVAVDRASGAQISAVATSRDEATGLGHFVLVLRPTTYPFDLVIRPTAARQMMGPVPTYRVHPEVLMPDLVTGNVRILIPASLPAVHWEGTVEYPETRGMTPVAGAVIQLHSDDVVDAATGVVGSLDLTLTTNELGRYDGQLLPGTYTISIAAGTSADDVLGVLHETRDLRTELVGHVFRLPLRTVLSGIVQSPDGDLVRDAQVRATPLGIPLMGLTDPSVARLARPTTARSGPMGDFRLDLDVGVYDIVVQPPDNSGFPWTIVLEYGIGGSTATLADVMQVDAPVVVDSDVTWLDGGVLAGAEVRAFAITPDGRAIMVGRGTSDAMGHARVLVPSSLIAHDPTMAFSRH